MTNDPRGNERGAIRSIATGVPGFDAVLGGGLPEYSFNLIAGGPGAGKTTLAQQCMFANATAEKPALYFTVLGEPTIKMLRYQRRFRFFDPAMIGSAIHFRNLSDEALQPDLTAVFDRIVEEVERIKPSMVIVDSFRSIIARSTGNDAVGSISFDRLVHRLALQLTTWEVTSFLLGEYEERELRSPIFTVADGIFWLDQAVDRNSVVRKLQAVKVRGRPAAPGLHTFRINENGIQVFPRIPEQQLARKSSSSERIPTGVPGLDEIMDGGIPSGDAIMLTGPAGSGKTTFATQFVAEGLRLGQPAVIVVFEEYPEEYLARAEARGQPFAEMVRAGKLEVIYLRPLDLSVDETLAEVLDAVHRVQATRVVIDSLSGFEIALAPAFREDFRESLYRLVGALTAAGITVIMTEEVVEGYPGLRFTSARVSFITDDIIMQRFVEIRGELRKVLAVIKMRGSRHSPEFREYEITAAGAVVGASLRDYHGILTGIPDWDPEAGRGHPGLTEAESALVDLLVRPEGVSHEVLAKHAELSQDELVQALERIVRLGYATSQNVDGETVYRAVASPRG